jgi:predicted phage tail component-like protein
MRSFSFNGITKSFVKPLRGSNRTPWAPVSREYQEVPYRPGALIRKRRKTEPHPLPVPVVLIAESIPDLQKAKEEFAAWLIHDDPKPLIFDDEADRTYYAVVDGSFDIDDFVETGQGTIPFVCPEPYKYGANEIVSIDGVNPVTILGTADIQPTITVTFVDIATEFVITHDSKSIRAIYNFIVGDELVLDVATRKVTLNGNVDMTILDWMSNWFDLSPGAQLITLSDTTVATVEMSYRPRWL